MALLALSLVFSVLVYVSDSYCYHDLPRPGGKYCIDGEDNSKHALGTTWTNRRCVRCTCSTNGMRCCDTMFYPHIQTEGCTVEYDYKKCTFEVFHTKDRTIECLYGVVGK